MATIQDLANLSAVVYGDKSAQNYLASNGWQLIAFSEAASNPLGSQFIADGYHGEAYQNSVTGNGLKGSVTD